MHLPVLTLGRVLLELCEDVAHELEDGPHELEDSERADAPTGAPLDRADD